MLNIYTRCDEHCKSEHCDDYGAEVCVSWHTEEEHFQPGHGFCAKMAVLSHGCEICQEYWAIWRELQDGETPKRVCHECQYLFELNTENPYGDVLYDEGAGAVYFECDGCTLLEGGDEDVEDYIDRMAERFPNGDDPMMKHVINAQCTKCEIGFELYAGEQAWCPECHIHKIPPKPPGVEILENPDIQQENKSVILSGTLRVHLDIDISILVFRLFPQLGHHRSGYLKAVSRCATNLV